MVAFILNPAAGGGRIGRLAPSIEQWAREAGLDPTLALTQAPGHATELAHTLAKTHSIVTAVGGDGTVHEVATGLLGSQAALGIIPMGSGNGLARHLGLPLNSRRAVTALAHLPRTRIDYGLANGIPFFLSCGLGLPAQVVEKFSTLVNRGLKGYAYQTLSLLRDRKTIALSLDIGQGPHPHSPLFVEFSNGPQWGNNAIIQPAASLLDGNLAITLVSDPHLWQLTEAIVSLFTGNINRLSYVDSFKAKQAFVLLQDDAHLHIDGEAKGQVARLQVEVVSKALYVLYDRILL